VPALCSRKRGILSLFIKCLGELVQILKEPGVPVQSVGLGKVRTAGVDLNLDVGVDQLQNRFQVFCCECLVAPTGEVDVLLRHRPRSIPQPPRERYCEAGYFEDLFEPFEEVVSEPQEFFERDDQIAVVVLVRLRPRGSSAVVENRIGHVWTIRDGKVARFEIFPEREKALEAIGLKR